MTRTLADFSVTRKWPAQHPERIQLYSLPTPNGVKVSIALEEMQLPYEAHLVSFQTNDQLVTQHESDFRETFGETLEQWNGLQRRMREDPAAAQRMMQDPELQQAVAMYQMVRGFKNRIDQLTSARRQIRFSSQLDEETKKRMTIELTTAIAGVSLTYNQARRKIDRRMEASR